MAERENLPVAIAIQAIAAPTEQRGSLVARGLAAVLGKERQQLSLPTETEAEKLFRQGMRYRYGEDGIAMDDYEAAVCFFCAADLDHAEAQFELAMLLIEQGQNDDADHWLNCSANIGFGPALGYLVMCSDLGNEERWRLLLKAREWYESRVTTGDAKRRFEFAEMLLVVQHLFEGTREEGFRWLIASAEQDYIPACYRLGHEYFRAEVSEQSTQQGIYWLSRAAELGRLPAYEDLGDLYLLGHGPAPNQWTAATQRIAPDKVAAVTWYERAIAKGMRRVAYKLGSYYLKGERLDQDLLLAEKWLLHAAHDGSASAQIALGEEYASGVRLRQDADSAIQWLKLAAESQSIACLKLAEIYLDGNITPRNFDEATEWLSRVAVHGVLRNRAMKMVAEKCFDGRFSAEDESYAQAWLDRVAKDACKSAADTEHPLAPHHAYKFAELYELGLGVEQSMEKAIHWYKRSAEQGLHVAQKRLKELGIEWKAP